MQSCEKFYELCGDPSTVYKTSSYFKHIFLDTVVNLLTTKLITNSDFLKINQLSFPLSVENSTVLVINLKRKPPKRNQKLLFVGGGIFQLEFICTPNRHK